MTTPDTACPVPNCGLPLLLVVSDTVYIDDRPQTDFTNDMSYASWSVECEEGHVIDSGGHELDGRTVLHGYRSAQSLGGLR